MLDAPAPAGAIAAGPPETPRDQQRLSATMYARRGYEYLSRPRPEDQDEAERLLGKALALDPDLAVAHAGLARVALYRFSLGLDQSPGRLESALAEARRAADLAPGDAVIRSTLALGLAAADRLTPALEEARRAVSLDPGAADGHLALGIILRLRRDLDGSLAECRLAGAIAPDDPRILVALGDTLRELERYGEAMEVYGQAIDLDQEAIVPQIGGATTLLKAEHNSAARRMFNLLLTKWDYARDRVALGAAALSVRLQDFEGALALYDRIELPDDASLPTLLALYGKAHCLQQLGRQAEAEYFLSTLIGRVPRDYDGPARGREILFQAYDDLIRYFTARGRDRKVETLLRAACDRPNAPTRLARRLASILEADDESDEAGALLEKAILAADPREDPLEISETALAMARLRTSAGRRRIADGSPAARALEAAAALVETSSLGVAHFRLARAQALAGESTAALGSLERAHRNGYMPIDQVTGEPDFEALRRDASFEAFLKKMTDGSAGKTP